MTVAALEVLVKYQDPLSTVALHAVPEALHQHSSGGGLTATQCTKPQRQLSGTCASVGHQPKQNQHPGAGCF